VPAYHDDVAMFADWAVVRSYQAADRPYRRTPDGERLGVLRAALATNPSSAALHNNLGATAFEGNAIDDARAALERARGLDASDPTIALNLGQLYLYLGRAADAVPLFGDAVRGAPLLYHAHLGLARAHLALGDAARARPALAEARRVRPDMTTWRTERQRLERLEGKGSAR
jgi:predicted Zn-dependent protease